MTTNRAVADVGGSTSDASRGRTGDDVAGGALANDLGAGRGDSKSESARLHRRSPGPAEASVRAGGFTLVPHSSQY
jgi:hypothetical protein